MEDARDRTKFLIDNALGKGDGTSNVFMRTWENFVYGRTYSSPYDGMSPKEILAVLENLTSEEVKVLKFHLGRIKLDWRTPLRASKLCRMVDLTQLARAISQHLRDDARDVMITLMKDIKRDDLVEEITLKD